MMSIEYMQQLSAEAAAEAAEQNLTPFVYATEAEVDDLPFPFPNLGDYVPEGWEMVDKHFCDASGFGAPDEPAYTVDQFQDVIRRRMREVAAERKTVGWGVIQEGQFQVYVGEFTKPVAAIGALP